MLQTEIIPRIGNSRHASDGGALRMLIFLADSQERLRYYRERASKLCEPYRTAALALTDNELLPVDREQQWSPFPWDNRGGKVTLAGDADIRCFLVSPELERVRRV